MSKTLGRLCTKCYINVLCLLGCVLISNIEAFCVFLNILTKNNVAFYPSNQIAITHTALLMINSLQDNTALQKQNTVSVGL